MKQSIVEFQERSPLGIRLWLLICLLILPVCSQVQEGGAAGPANLIEKVRAGQFSTADLREIVRTQAVRAVPALEAQFNAVGDPIRKQAVASALVSLGDRQQSYWDFLADKANAAIASDAPFVSDFDSQGNTIPRRLSSRFLEWAKAHQVEPNQAASAQVYGLPGDIIFLAITGDPRGLPILRRGLLSQNYFIQAHSAKGLALLKDKDSIPLIIDACERAPAELGSLIARALLFFDDVDAQKSANRFILNRELLEDLRKLSREKGPFEVL